MTSSVMSSGRQFGQILQIFKYWHNLRLMEHLPDTLKFRFRFESLPQAEIEMLSKKILGKTKPSDHNDVISDSTARLLLSIHV